MNKSIIRGIILIALFFAGKTFAQDTKAVFELYHVTFNGKPVSPEQLEIDSVDYVIAGEIHSTENDEEAMLTAFDVLIPETANVLVAFEGGDAHKYESKEPIILEMGTIEGNYIVPTYDALKSLDSTRTIQGTTWDQSYSAFKDGFLWNYIVRDGEKDKYVGKKKGKRKKLQKLHRTNLVQVRNDHAEKILPQLRSGYDLVWIMTGSGHISEDSLWMRDQGNVLVLYPKDTVYSENQNAVVAKTLQKVDTTKQAEITEHAESYIDNYEQSYKEEVELLNKAGFKNWAQFQVFFSWYDTVSIDNWMVEDLWKNYERSQEWSSGNMLIDSIELLMEGAKLEMTRLENEIALKELEMYQNIVEEAETNLDTAKIKLDSMGLLTTWNSIEQNAMMYADTTSDLVGFLTAENDVTFKKVAPADAKYDDYKDAMEHLNVRMRYKQVVKNSSELQSNTEKLYEALKEQLQRRERIYQLETELRDNRREAFVDAFTHPTERGATFVLEMMGESGGWLGLHGIYGDREWIPKKNGRMVIKAEIIEVEEE